MRNLLEQSFEEIQNLSNEINNIKEIGLSHDVRMRNKQTQIIATYPPTNSMTENKLDNYKLKDHSTLYVHIPFCTGICTYCAYATKSSTSGSDEIWNYLDYLEKEISLVRENIIKNSTSMSSIYIGGGTPSILNEEQLTRLFNILGQFSLVEKGEYTFEVCPETVTAEKLEISKQFGVNRISMGVESFNDEILKSVNRRHDKSQALNSIDLIHKYFDNLDIDLIRGLPGYTSEMYVDDINYVRSSGVNSITSYQYCMKPKSIDSKSAEIDFSEEQTIKHHNIILNGMHILGYQHYPIDWFVKNHLFEHQLNKWKKGHNQVAVGLGSYGIYGNVQFSNHRTRKYYDSLDKDELPIEKTRLLSPEDEVTRKLIFDIKTEVDLDDPEYGDFSGFEKLFGGKIKALINAGAMKRHSNTLRLTKLGVLYAEPIQELFYQDKFCSHSA